MKNIAFFSTDFSMCVSLLMFLQNKYNITATTDINVLLNIIKTSEIDLIIMDTEPTSKIQGICSIIKKDTQIPVILTYVYRNQIKELENEIRQYVNSIFYKPYDLNEVTLKVSSLVA